MERYNVSRRKLLPNLRFSISALLAFAALAAICAFFYLQYTNRRDAIALLDQHGFQIKYADPQEVPFYLRLGAALVGERAVYPVREIGNFVEVHHPGVLDAVAQLTELKHLKLEYQEEAIALDKLSALDNVERVTAIKGWVIEDSFLKSFTHLEAFSWDEGTFQSDLSVFGQHEHLREIWIDSIAAKVTNDSFAQLCECRRLEKLKLNVNALELSDLSPILKLKNLKEVRGILDPKKPEHIDLIDQLPAGCIVE